MDNQQNRNSLISLRSHVRTTWRACAAAFYIVEDILGPERWYLTRTDPKFHSIDAAVLLYLTSSRAFIRTADKAAKTIGVSDLNTYRENLDKEFPAHKNARDIIEHFEDYALGEGRLQKKGLELKGNAINVFRDDKKLTYIQIFDLEPIELSKLSWWIDGFNFYIEKSLHHVIDPIEEWKGLWPQYNYVAPEDWKSR